MSIILDGFYDVRCSHIVKCNGKVYYVDSVETSDCGLETMVFKCDENGEVTDWTDLYCERYNNYAEMLNRHDYIINHLEEFINA